MQYFYEDTRKRENFMMMPKELFKEERFSSLSLEAKNLYCMMLDRMSLSAQNGYKDEDGRIFIFFTLKEAMEKLGVGKNKCLRIFSELDVNGGVGLIERKKSGQGRAAKIYVLNYTENDEAEVVSEENLKRFQNQTSRGFKNKPLEVSKTNPNKTDINKTENNNTDLNKSFLSEEKTSYSLKEAEEKIRRETIKSDVKENIDYDVLKERCPLVKLDAVVDLITDCLSSNNSFFIIGKEKVLSRDVKNRLSQLDFSHIEYVLECMQKNTSLIKNMKAYLLTSLYNAPLTMEFYYDALVKRDLS